MIVVFILLILVSAIILLPSQLTAQKDALLEVQYSLDNRMEQLKKDFQFRTKELARRLDSGDLAQDEWQKLTDELQLDTRASIDSTQVASESNKVNNSWVTSIILMITVLGLSYVTYQFSGSYEQTKQQMDIIKLLKSDAKTIDKLTASAQKTQSQQSLNNLYLALRSKVELLPSNIYSWRALAMFNASYGRMSEAREAMDIAMDIEPDNLDLKLDLSQILGQSENKQDLFASRQLISEVLKEEPNHQDALLLLGLSSYRFGFYQMAIDTWNKLLKVSSPDSAIYTMVESRISKAQEMLSGDPEISEHAVTTSPHDDSKATKVSSQITVSVNIPESVRSRLNGDEGLFIFAKAVDGPKFPIAAVRTTVAELNNEIILSDANAMRPEFALSKYSQIKVIARISFAGDAVARTGDIQGESDVIKKPFPKETITITLDEEVK